MDSLQEIYEVIRQRMDVTRKFRHDLLSHVQTLEYLIEKQKNPDGELRKYADQLTETYRKIQKGTFCRDEITDAFLMMEKQVCIEKEIPFQIQVSKTCMEWMMPVERIGFLHNLLDNAIEANGRIPEKERKELSFWIEEDSDSCTVKLRNALASKEVSTYQPGKQMEQNTAWEPKSFVPLLKNTTEPAKPSGIKKDTAWNRPLFSDRTSDRKEGKRMKDPNLSELVRTCIRCWLYLVPQAFLGIHLFDMFMRRKTA